ncbi:hypothetical protein [Terriglobus sp. TAA 43]|uniref:hypothetical protein n=1 Tax=Terriglobus sp. TAA 43 TaxID=278961 RepID=UPI0012ED4181|nr:hypothetical protein [Terriglobus sp. TAA 43]
MNRNPMRWTVLPVLLGVATTLTAAQPTPFTNQSKPMKAHVRILAVSSSSHQSFAGDQDTYLADVSTKDNEHQFVKLVDQYPGFGLPIRPDLLRNQQVFEMEVTREPECDAHASDIYLRPSDSVLYDGSVRDTLNTHAADAIPCYKTLHQTIKLAKK